jgi:tetratricopeptide (TPR) repeat protein
MSYPVKLARAALPLLGLVLLSGCPSPQGRMDEEKEPHFLAGKARINAMDYQGAIESFEKALDANPNSAAAHFELACLSEQNQADPAEAIYHYDHFLKLRPNAANAEIVRAHIIACKQELARTVSLGPLAQGLQTELERLRDQNQRLRDEVETWRAYALRLQSLTNSTTVSAPSRGAQAAASAPFAAQTIAAIAASADSSRSSRTASSKSSGSGGKTHTIKPGETPTTIAKRYGVRVTALLAANPRLDERHLRVGQTLNLPMQ